MRGVGVGGAAATWGGVCVNLYRQPKQPYRLLFAMGAACCREELAAEVELYKVFLLRRQRNSP